MDIDVNIANVGHHEALEKLEAGEIEGMIVVGSKPLRLLADLRFDEGFHIVPLPYSDRLAESYRRMTLSSDDYAGLIDPAGPIQTLAVENVMAVYNWRQDSAQYEKVSRFVEAFFDQLPALKRPPNHVKWEEVDLAAEFPGWSRFAAADSWIDQNAESAGAGAANDDVVSGEADGASGDEPDAQLLKDQMLRKAPM